MAKSRLPDVKNFSVCFCQITSRLAWTLPSIHLAKRGCATLWKQPGPAWFPENYLHEPRRQTNRDNLPSTGRFLSEDFRNYLVGTNDNILSNGWTECYQDPHCQCFHQSLARLPLDATRDEKISYIDRLANEILEKILTETLLSSAFSWQSHVWF